MNEDEVKEALERAANADETDVELELDRLLAMVRELEAYAETPLPGTVDELKRTGTEKLFEGIDLARFGIITGYDEDDERADRQRLVRIRDAAIAMYAAEDDLLATEVQSAADSFLAPLENTVKAVRLAIKHRKILWKVARKVFAKHEVGLIVTIVLLAVSLGVIINASLTMTEFAASAARMIKARDFHADYLRERALPQRSQTRYVRRRRQR